MTMQVRVPVIGDANSGTHFFACPTGSWDSQANHQAAIFGTSPNSVCTDRALRLYTDPARGGVHPSKLVLGASAPADLSWP
jgi:hypothetical protein